MTVAMAILAAFVMFRLMLGRRRRSNARQDLTQAYRADTAGLHSRSPKSWLRGSGGGL